MQRRLCAAILLLEAIAFGLCTPVLTSVQDVSTATGLWIGLGLTVACLVVAGLLRFSWAYGLGWAVQVAAVPHGVRGWPDAFWMPLSSSAGRRAIASSTPTHRSGT